MQSFVDTIRAALVELTALPADEVRLETPRDAELGDLAFPCFALAKTLRKAPPAIAAELAEKLAPALERVEVRATGPYLNFRLDRAALAAEVLGAVEARAERYGSSDEGAGRRIVIDFSSPNIGKPIHVGNLRSTIIGAALGRIFDALGYETVGINHIGDWGSQFGKLVAALDRWGESVDLEHDATRALLELYVRFHKEVEGDPSLDEEAKAAFRELESGEEGHVRETWRRISAASLRDLDALYDRLGVRFDLTRGEAYFEPFLQETIERIRRTGITEESDGALIVDLSSESDDMPPCLLRKSDGTTLYATRDFAAVFHRWEEYAFDRCLYVVGSSQKLHFRQLRAVLARMGVEWVDRVEHVDFGMLSLPEGKMATREGKVVLVDEVLDRAVEEARRIIEANEAEKRERGKPLLEDPDAIAEEVGIGAVIFNDLKRERVKDVKFVWEEVLSFEGETGPYVQYTHARLASILRKADAAGAPRDGADLALLDDAGGILLALGRFPAVLRSAADQAEPSEIAQYLLGLCREVSSWYTGHRVLGQEAPLTAARLSLVSGAKTVIGNGLRLLGLAAPEEM